MGAEGRSLRRDGESGGGIGGLLTVSTHATPFARLVWPRRTQLTLKIMASVGCARRAADGGRMRVPFSRLPVSLFTLISLNEFAPI